MITIKVDTQKEKMFIKEILGAGTANYDIPYVLNALGVGLEHEIEIKESEKYTRDLDEPLKEFRKKYEGLTLGDIERKLREEAYEKEKKEKATKEPWPHRLWPV
jgi:hypothetical protein